MSKANRNGGCLWGFIKLLIIALPIIYAYESIVRLFGDKKVVSTTHMQTVDDRVQQKILVGFKAWDLMFDPFVKSQNSITI